MRVRREKLERLRAAGVDPYPVGFPRTTTLADLRAAHPDLPADTPTGERPGVTGRVVLSRTGGKLCFATLRDGTADLQVMLSLDRLGEERLAAWKADIDLGDHVGVEGEVITSKRGELSIMVDRWELTAKCLRPLPDKHKGLTDPEARVRQRYVDLIVNPEARELLYLRSKVVRSVRRTYEERGFTEVETPMMQPVHGGANARPFRTHINAYDMDLFMRIAPELYLKRLAVGGAEKIFEINRNFRNEGADSTHNPEFTMLESYEAYGDYDTQAELIRATIINAARDALGTTVIRGVDPHGGEHQIRLDGPSAQAPARGQERPCEGVKVREGVKGLIASIPGVEDRDAADALRGVDVLVPRSALPPPADGEYYWVDLEGLRVVNAEGVDFGSVSHLFSTGANDVLVAKGDRERMIPFVQPDFIRSVDFAAGLVTVDWDADF